MQYLWLKSLNMSSKDLEKFYFPIEAVLDNTQEIILEKIFR